MSDSKIKSLYYLPEVPSTNDEVLVLHRPGQSLFTGVYTFNQTRGRGQYGNRWQAMPGLNLAYSLIIDQKDCPLQAIQFNFYTALILRDYISSFVGEIVEVKWPNDLILKEKKIMGILIETQKIGKEHYFVLGCGLNVLQEHFHEVSKAGSLKSLTGRDFDLHHLAEGIHVAFQKAFEKWPESEALMNEYNQHLFRKDQISVFDTAWGRQNGIIRGAEASGYLTVELEKNGLQKFYNKEISLLY